MVKHPGSGGTTLSSSTGRAIDDTGSAAQGQSGRLGRKEATAQDLLASKGFIPITWYGKCEADKVSIGSYDVQPGQGGMYGLVFDNTFSKQTSKTATFVVLTYPTGQPPQGVHNLPNLQSASPGPTETTFRRTGQTNFEGAAASQDSLHSPLGFARPRSVSNRSNEVGSSVHHVGTLLKRRRKKGQGYARRFFSLDYSTCTLSYYYNKNSSALRGAIPLSLAAVAADERRREITIDSGAEVWHLRTPNDREFQEWARALERASQVARGAETLSNQVRSNELSINTRDLQSPLQYSREEDAEWQQVETLVSRVVGSRDALRRLTKDIAALHKRPTSGHFLSPGSGPSQENLADGYFPVPAERKPFWKRKSSAPALSPTIIPQAGHSALSMSSPSSPPPPPASPFGYRMSKRRSKGVSAGEETSLPGHCEALLFDLDSVVSEFTSLIATSKRRRIPPPSAGAASRRSMETMSTVEEFFDAADAESAVVRIDGSDDETPGVRGDDESAHDSSSVSSIGEEVDSGPDGIGHLFPPKPRTLGPLPLEKPLERRTTIPQATVPPPSLIAFVRKNVGKDLSTISMPVSANEPLSLLQKVAEQLEYCSLLDQAARYEQPIDRLAYVATFAISQFSSGRTKERAVRKPFTPLLGETFELVRTDKEVPGGLRLLVEKVQHRPVKLAMHADSMRWSFAQSPSPAQKFWGKSAEITTDGRVRVVLRLSDGTDELYSWNIATMFLRNVVMGEKYVEPVGTMYVVNDSTGSKAAVEFRSKGMFGGRAEDVHVTMLDPEGRDTGTGLVGTWTGGLRLTVSGKPQGDEIWHVGELVDNAAQTYGMTRFAASLNEITEIEKGQIPPTDTRLRPDQRMAEHGKLDDAEGWKVRLEEAQRVRRRVMEEEGGLHQPKWFVRADKAPDGEEVWKLKAGRDGYWDERSKKSWAGVTPIFDV